MQTENKNERVVCVKNMTPEKVLLHTTKLRNALGIKVKKLKTRHVTEHPLASRVLGQLILDFEVLMERKYAFIVFEKVII
ncbi:hypothetical protein Tsubulata_034587 [Turnera subulata]|uniref:Uncharacterized protein n=1 Tax=Turnera subulata TaxID=218843 RepID=A0A9Q0F8X8_9ROSI|nr:hypothetical protein Tsubulata_034587 [Turnera subulata]